MRSITTTKCHDYGHPELVLAFEPGCLRPTRSGLPAPLSKWFSRGLAFRGQSLQIGWSVACPRRCAGRTRVMFAGMGKIGCRRCLRVRYRSQCGDAKDRAHLAIAKIERRLITRRGRFYKPKGMLWRTFHRLCDRYDHHDAVLNAGLVRAVQRLGRRFGSV
jgi:hypothetical protein